MEWILIAYLVVINIIAIYATIHDKRSGIPIIFILEVLTVFCAKVLISCW